MKLGKRILSVGLAAMLVASLAFTANCKNGKYANKDTEVLALLGLIGPTYGGQCGVPNNSTELFLYQVTLAQGIGAAPWDDNVCKPKKSVSSGTTATFGLPSPVTPAISAALSSVTGTNKAMVTVWTYGANGKVATKATSTSLELASSHDATTGTFGSDNGFNCGAGAGDGTTAEVPLVTTTTYTYDASNNLTQTAESTTCKGNQVIAQNAVWQKVYTYNTDNRLTNLTVTANTDQTNLASTATNKDYAAKLSTLPIATKDFAWTTNDLKIPTAVTVTENTFIVKSAIKSSPAGDKVTVVTKDPAQTTVTIITTNMGQLVSASSVSTCPTVYTAAPTPASDEAVVILVGTSTCKSGVYPSLTGVGTATFLASALVNNGLVGATTNAIAISPVSAALLTGLGAGGLAFAAVPAGDFLTANGAAVVKTSTAYTLDFDSVVPSRLTQATAVTTTGTTNGAGAGQSPNYNAKSSSVINFAYDDQGRIELGGGCTSLCIYDEKGLSSMGFTNYTR